MLHSTRFCLPAAALVAAVALPLVLWMGAAAEDAALTPIPESYPGGDRMEMQRSPCSCRSGGGGLAENDVKSFEIVEFLHPRWSDESILEGEDFALVYTDVRGLTADYYLLRVYSSADDSLATLVNRHGEETPFDAEFAAVEQRGRRSVRIYLDLVARSDGNAPNAPPTEEELDLTCGDDNWVLVVWREDDGSIGWDAECCDDGEC